LICCLQHPPTPTAKKKKKRTYNKIKERGRQQANYELRTMKRKFKRKFKTKGQRE